NMILRKMGNSVTPTVELKKDGDVYTFTTSSTFKTSSFSFKVGEEFDEETLDGRKVKTVCTFEGDNKLVQQQKGDKPTTIVREFKDNE
uniref:Lipocalin/cytosolic fatty-acid binding domain-containing protein n=1 Tax=Megaselia scalaris TaxID=36166 RepID=T1H605_MEGSC